MAEDLARYLRAGSAIWKQWKRGKRRFAELLKRGVGTQLAAQTVGRPRPLAVGKHSPALASGRAAQSLPCGAQTSTLPRMPIARLTELSYTDPYVRWFDRDSGQPPTYVRSLELFAPASNLCFSSSVQFPSSNHYFPDRRVISCYPLPCLSRSIGARATPVLPDPEARPSPVFHSSALPSSTKNLLRSNLLSLQLSSPLTLLESTLAQKRGKGGWPLLSSSQLSCCCAGYFQHAPQRELACRLNPRINPKGPWPTPNPFSSKANSQKPTEPSANT